MSRLLAVTTISCIGDAAARPQLVLYVDTDAHLVGELDIWPEVSPDAAIDTLRIDVLDGSGEIEQGRTFDVYARDSLPLSFGVADDAAKQVSLRLRMFRARDAITTAGLLTPYPETSIDRLVRVTIPQQGTEYLRVMLSFDCLGRGYDLADNGSTCVDRARQAVAPTEGIDQLRSDEKPTSEAGSWTDAIERPCAAPSDGDRTCIPGGFSILGNRFAVGSTIMPDEAPAPLQPVVVSPFLMDTHEVTVGRLRELLTSNTLTGALPQRVTDDELGGLGSRHCTWLGNDDETNDALPVNCVTYETAAEVCKLSGGRLPTEAEWEHAARGRGESRLYPWGNDQPRWCCMMSISRWSSESACGADGEGPEPVGAHPPDDACDGLGDVSRDGVFDLAGSVREATSDYFVSYAKSEPGCWDEPIAYDPHCTVPQNFHTIRGASWADSSPAANAISALRSFFFSDSMTGFRCVYPEQP